MRKLIYLSILFAYTISACAGKNIEKQTEEINNSKEVKKMGTIHLTKAEFLAKVANYETNPTEWKYLGDKPCILDFYATWCGPCKMVAPILEDLANEYDGQIYIYKIDVDAEPELAAAYGIQSIPTIFFCPMNGTPQVSQGAIDKESFKKTIAEFLLKK